MSILKTTKTALLGSVLAMGFASGALAEDYTITVWSGGTGETGSYRWEAIQMAADILEREYAVTGQDVSITVEHQEWSGWDDFKQAVTLAAEAGNAPNIIVSGHEDIGPWSRSGLLRPVEDYVDFDAWPLSQIYPNLIDIASYDGVVWGLPQDAEARPFFFSRAHLAEIGYSQEEIDALPQRVQDGEYTLYDMLDDAKAMQDKGVVAERRGFMPRVNNGTDYWQFYVSFGGDMVDPETGKLVLDRQALTDMYQFFVDAADMGVVSSTHLGTTWDDWHQAVSSDQVGIWHGGTWHKAEWEAKWGLEDFFGEIQYSLIPAGNERGRANTISHPLVYLLSNTGTDDDAVIASELITIATEPRIAALHAVKSGKVAIGSEEAKVPVFANDRWSSIATTELLPYATAVPNDIDFGVVWKAMYAGLESSWTGTSSVEDAVNTVESEVTGQLGDAIIVR
ncbi:extracellular solute-binding protein [Martelella lutilitoris]|uniref:Extracellular solute-binding protein n=1 Tax=Martelella lutilitoris TaxID=2583532 RepID=A0A7T7KKU8_9HYPH|nr:extracellular solute-binding protein [Martelella lutilitoris]QQM30002.1 extracellular solute-binding protein [Martelella lutilitoris]